MSLAGKLERWQRGGVIDAETAQRIATFEEQQRRPIALYAMAALGAGTVALGVVSIVAANWDAIPARVKLGCDLALLAGLAYATLRAVRAEAVLATEALVTLLYGVTLASLALVGQIYQLGTPTHQALLLWSFATGPLVLLAKTRYVAVVTVAGLVTTHASALEAFVEWLERLMRGSQALGENLVATVFYASPLAYVALGRAGWLLRHRPEHARVLSWVGFVGVTFGGFALGFVWYDDVNQDRPLTWSLLATAALSGALVAALPRLYPGVRARVQLGLAVALGLAWLSLALGTTLPRPELELVGALAQLAFLAALAWTSVQAGLLRVFNALTAAIALRILATYFEVFHSLLSTGLGLITGGVLTLLLAWLWRRKAGELAARLAGDEPGKEAHA